MYYKICIDDDSYIIADENYKLTLFYMVFMKKELTVKEILDNPYYLKYHLMDDINGTKVNRDFRIEEVEGEPPYPIGSRLKDSQNIRPGDLVMGPDGKPQVVDHLHRGEDDMYEIECNGQTYTVNGGHILELVDTETNEELAIPVNVYMHMTDEFKSHYVMLQVVDNPEIINT